MIIRYKEWHGGYYCDDCGAVYEHFTADLLADLDVVARSNGWAISKDHQHCYCPKCAEAHRGTGMYGAEYKKRMYSTTS